MNVTPAKHFPGNLCFSSARSVCLLFYASDKSPDPLDPKRFLLLTAPHGYTLCRVRLSFALDRQRRNSRLFDTTWKNSMWVQRVHIPLSAPPLSHPASFLLSVILKIHSSFPSWCLRHHLLVSLRVRPHEANLSPPHLQRINILCSAKYFIPALLFELKISGPSHQFGAECHFFPPKLLKRTFS